MLKWDFEWKVCHSLSRWKTISSFLINLKPALHTPRLHKWERNNQIQLSVFGVRETRFGQLSDFPRLLQCIFARCCTLSTHFDFENEFNAPRHASSTLLGKSIYNNIHTLLNMFPLFLVRRFVLAFPITRGLLFLTAPRIEFCPTDERDAVVSRGWNEKKTTN